MPKARKASNPPPPSNPKYMPCGVDLGLDGGLVSLHNGKPTDVFKTPSRRVKIFHVKKSKKSPYEVSTSRVYDAIQMRAELELLKESAENLGYVAPMVMLENYTIRTGISHPKSYISTGGCLSTWQDSLTSAGIPFLVVPPRSWKSDLDLSSSKELSLATAIAFFGEDAPELITKDHNIAEAALLARWFLHNSALHNVLNGLDTAVLTPVGRKSRKK